MSNQQPLPLHTPAFTKAKDRYDRALRKRNFGTAARHLKSMVRAKTDQLKEELQNIRKASATFS